MRCLALSDYLAGAGWSCAYACRGEAWKFVPPAAPPGVEVLVLRGDAGSEPAALEQKWRDGCHILVVDHYERGIEFETACRPWAQKVMVIDDLVDRPHECDMLLDQNPGRTASDYAGLVPDHCRLLLGPKFALIRQDFVDARADSLSLRRRLGVPLRVIISFGALDGKNMIPVILRGLAETDIDIEADVMIVAAAAHVAEIRDLISRLPFGVKLHVGSTNIAALLKRADVAIGAAGSSSWERCCLGVPCLVIATSERQRRIASDIGKTGAVLHLGWHEDIGPSYLARKLSELASDAGALAAMSRRAADLCDGLGASRVASELGSLAGQMGR